MSTQEHEVFGLKVYKNSHPVIRKMKREGGASRLHGNKVWKSSLLMMDYLKELPIDDGARVLELGCGWGLSGIYCAKEFGAKVTSLDADCAVFPYLECHAALNGVELRPWQNSFEKIRMRDFDAFDVVIGADICFWDELSPTLFNLIRRVKRAGDIRIVMTDPGRPPFTSMAKRAVDIYGGEFTDWFVQHPFNVSGVVLDI